MGRGARATMAAMAENGDDEARTGDAEEGSNQEAKEAAMIRLDWVRLREEIVKLREQANLAQADIDGMSAGTVSRMENLHRHPNYGMSLNKVALIFQKCRPNDSFGHWLTRFELPTTVREATVEERSQPPFGGTTEHHTHGRDSSFVPASDYISKHELRHLIGAVYGFLLHQLPISTRKSSRQRASDLGLDPADRRRGDRRGSGGPQ